MCLFTVRVGGEVVKGTHAQTGFSLGITSAYSCPLFNGWGEGGGAQIAPEPFIMGQFVVVLLSRAINTTHHIC